MFCHSSLQILSSVVRLDGDHRWTAIFRSLHRCLIGFKSGLWLGYSRTFKVVMKPILSCLGCVLWVFVLLEHKPFAQSEVLSSLDQVFIKDISLLYSVQLSLNPDHFSIKSKLVECYSGACPSGGFFHLHTGSLELSQSDHRVLGHLSYQGLSPPMAQFGQFSQFFHLRIMEATVPLGMLNTAEFYCSLPQICALTQSCLGSSS